MNNYMIIAISSILLFVGCSTQKKVMEQTCVNAHYPIHYSDSLYSTYNQRIAEVYVVDFFELAEQSYHFGTLPREDEYMPYNLKETESSKQTLRAMSNKGEIGERLFSLVQSFSEQHRLQIKDKDVIHMYFTYCVPIDDVNNYRLIRVQVSDFSSELNPSEAKALFEFAESMPIEFEYQQYKDYTTGYLTPTKAFWCRMKKSQ